MVALTPEVIVDQFTNTHGDQALPKLVRLTAGEYGPVLTSHRVRYQKAIRILIHRVFPLIAEGDQNPSLAEIAAPLFAAPAPPRHVWRDRFDPYTPGHWTGD